MSDLEWQEQAAKTARILQIIVGAMAAGAFVFLVVALIIGQQFKPPSPILLIPLIWIVALFVGVELVARAVVLWNITRKARREIINGTYQPVDWRQRIGRPPSDIADKPPDPCRDAKYLLSVFQQSTIASAALFEGCVFFAIIAYLIEGNPLSLGLAVLLALAVAAHLPTQSRAIAWIERQMERLQEEKMMRCDEGQIMKSQDQWPFGDPKNVAVITLKSIVKGGKPILHVAHDGDDGTWQFLDGSTVSQENAAVVSLEEITRIDPTVVELTDLPLGWYADRSAAGEPWRRGRKGR